LYIHLSKRKSVQIIKHRDGTKLFWGTVAQHNRQIMRLFLLSLFMMGLFGSCYAYRNWQITPETLQLSGFTEQGDWIDFVSLIGEQAIQWFLEWTAESES